MKKLVSLFVLALTLFSQTATAQCGSHKKSSQVKSYSAHKQDIVDIAAGAEDFSTLVAAVTAADLVSTLKTDGPFTVFAPSNAAFAKLPEGTVASLLEPSAKSTLTGILTYHVVAAEISAETLVNAINAAGGEFVIKTVNGKKLRAMIMNGNPVLMDTKGNKSFITQTDIKGSNGVIHSIDSVVMP